MFSVSASARVAHAQSSATAVVGPAGTAVVASSPDEQAGKAAAPATTTRRGRSLMAPTLATRPGDVGAPTAPVVDDALHDHRLRGGVPDPRLRPPRRRRAAHH